MWDAIKNVYEDFGFYQQDDFFSLIETNLKLASSEARDSGFKIYDEGNSSPCMNTVKDVLNFLKEQEAKTDDIAKVQRFVQVNQELKSLKGILMKQIIDTKAELHKIDHLEDKLSLFRIQTAIEKSGKIILSIDAKDQDNQRHPFSELFNRYKDIVFIGEPGSGKSWSLALSYNLLFNELSNADQKEPRWVPVYLTASETIKIINEIKEAEKNNASEGKFIQDLLMEILQTHSVLKRLPTKDLTFWLANSGCFLFIFDALNEIDIELRKEFAKYIGELRKLFIHNRFVLACRTLHWNPGLFSDFRPVVEVQPLDSNETMKFVSEFFRFLNREKDGLDLINILSAPGLETSMKELRTNPFFLDKITKLYASRAIVPKNRGDLFKDYIAAYAKDRNWFDLQNWMLGYVGLYMTYKNITEISETTARNLLLLGFASAPEKYFSEDEYHIPDNFELKVAEGAEVKEEDVLAASQKNFENEITAKCKGRIIKVEKNKIVIHFGNLLEVSDEIHQLGFQHEAVVEHGQCVKVGEVLATIKNSNKTIIAETDGKVILDDRGKLTISPFLFRPEETEEFLNLLNKEKAGFRFTIKPLDDWDKSLPELVINRLKELENQSFSNENQILAKINTGDIGLKAKPYNEIIKNYIREVFFNLNSLSVKLQRFNSLENDYSSAIIELDHPFFKRFHELLNRLRKNAYFDQKSFIHQSIQEYFAALRFDVLYEDNPLSLQEYLSFQKYDEMLHIVIGCVFQGRTDSIKDILKTLLDQTQIAEVRNALAKSEYIEPELKGLVHSRIQHYYRDSNAPAQVRGIAMECLPFLIEMDPKKDEIFSLLQDSSLKEHPETWEYLLEVSYQWYKKADFSDDSFRNSLTEGLRIRNRRDELLIRTARWIDKNKYIFLNPLLADEFINTIQTEIYNPKVSQTLWLVLKQNGGYFNSYNQWILALDSIEEPKLYDEILNHTEFDSYYSDYFSPGKLEETMAVLSKAKEDWQIPLISMLKLVAKIGIQEKIVTEQILSVCSAHGDFPQELLENMWQLNARTIVDFEIDTKTVDWYLNQPLSNRPTRLGKHIFESLTKEDAATICYFDRIFPKLVQLAITPDNEFADHLISIIKLIADSCKECDSSSQQLELYLKLFVSDLNAIVTQFDNWLSLNQEEKSILQIVVRERRDEFDSKAFIPFWEKNLENNITVLLYMGKATDYFVRENPNLIRKVFPPGSLKEEVVESNLQYLIALKSNSPYYSTSITIYQAFSNSSKWEKLNRHPGHPRPVKGNDAFDSLIRLLQFDFTNEAAYILANNTNVWDQVEQDIPEELLTRFKAAKVAVDGFSPTKASRPKIIEKTQLNNESVIDELSKNSNLINVDLIPDLLEYLFGPIEKKKNKELLTSLSRSKAWKDQELIRPTRHQILEIALDNYKFSSDTKKAFDLFRKYFTSNNFPKTPNYSSNPFYLFSREEQKSWFTFLENIIDSKDQLQKLKLKIDSLPEKILDDDIRKALEFYFQKILKQEKILSDSKKNESKELFEWVFKNYIRNSLEFDSFSRRSHFRRSRRRYRSIEVIPQWVLKLSIEELNSTIKKIWTTLNTHFDCTTLLKKLMKDDSLTDEIDMWDRSWEFRNHSFSVSVIKFYLEQVDKTYKEGNDHVLFQIPEIFELKGSRIQFNGTYADVLVVIAKVLQNISPDEEVTEVDLLQLLETRLEHFKGKSLTSVIKELYNLGLDEVDLYELERSYAFRRFEYMRKRKGSNSHIELLIFTKFFLQFVERFIDISDAQEKFEISHKELRLKYQELISLFDSIYEELPMEVLDSVIKLYSELKHTAKQSREQGSMTSFSDIRTIQFWKLRDAWPQWVTEDTITTITSLFGNLPQSLLKSLGEDLLENMTYEEQDEDYSLWALSRLSIIEKAKSGVNLELDNYEQLVNLLIGLSKNLSSEVLRSIIVDLICSISKKQDKLMILEKLIAIKIKEYRSEEKKSSPETNSIETITQYPNFNETIWAIVQKVRENQGYKIPISSKFD